MYICKPLRRWVSGSMYIRLLKINQKTGMFIPIDVDIIE